MGKIISWSGLNSFEPKSFKCGFCGNDVGSKEGYFGQTPNAIYQDHIYICPACSRPSFFNYLLKQFPAIRLGRDIKWITDEKIEALYNEARDATSVGAYTAAVMICRKLLMNIAIQKKAKTGLSFNKYVEYLVEAGYVPPDGRDWVDDIRDKGNEANHEIDLMTASDAQRITYFTEMLLIFVYELPGMQRDASSKTLAEKKP